MDSNVSCRVEHWLISTVCCSGVRLSNSLLKTVRKSSTYTFRTRKSPGSRAALSEEARLQLGSLGFDWKFLLFCKAAGKRTKNFSKLNSRGDRIAWIWNIFHTLFYLYNEILDRSLRQSYHLLALLKSETKSAADPWLPQEGLSRWPTPYSIQANLRSF